MPRFVLAAILALLTASCGDDDQGNADTGPMDMGTSGVDMGTPDRDMGTSDRDMATSNPDLGPPDLDAGDDDPSAHAAREAAGEELVDARLWIALADSLFDFDPTLDPALTPEENALRIQARVTAVAPCAMVSVTGAVVTVGFGPPPGCALTTGLQVSGTVTATLSKTGGETTVTLSASSLVVNGRTLTGSIVFLTSDGSMFGVTSMGSATTLALTVSGGMGSFTVSGTVMTTRTAAPTTVMISDVVWERGACYPRAGTLTITYALPRSVTQTITFEAMTPVTGVATLRSGTRTMSFALPTYAGCPPVCGDGARRTPEACDDANTRDGDGCSGMCTVEPPAPGGVIDFDQLPDGSELAAGVELSDQYAALGATFSSGGSPCTTLSNGEASSAPNFLIGAGGNSFLPMTIVLTSPRSMVGLTMISVGEGTATITAHDGSGAVVDSEIVTHPGGGVGMGVHDDVVLSGAGIVRVEVGWITDGSDGVGIDDVRL